MTLLPTVPKPVAKFAELAESRGFRVEITFADGPPTNVALRIYRPEGSAFAWWTTQDGVRWKGGATCGHRSLRTARAFSAFLSSFPESAR